MRRSTERKGGGFSTTVWRKDGMTVATEKSECRAYNNTRHVASGGRLMLAEQFLEALNCTTAK